MDEIKGLTQKEVEERIAKGKVNVSNSAKTKTIKEIILSNTITYFNILNIVLSLAVLISGAIFGNFLESLKNSTFLGVMICNTVISIVQEVMSKKTIDKLSILSTNKAHVIRDGKDTEIMPEEIVSDDAIKFSIGSQIMVDAIVASGSIEVNESFITGETNTITKKEGDELLSGSFVVSGNCVATVTRVGNDNYINVLSNEAKQAEHNKSVIFNSFEKLLKILSYVLIPIGIAFFLNQYSTLNHDIGKAIIATVAALIGMIPEGLVLLTSSVMAVSVIKLSKEKVLVQQLYCIETLARVNCICLDKTGTITTGNMKVVDLEPRNNFTKSDIEYALIKIMNAMNDTSSTFEAIRKCYPKEQKVNVEGTIPFSSERKFSACRVDGVSYYIGAPEYVLKYNLDLIDDKIKEKQDDYRTLVVTKRDGDLIENPNNLTILGYVLIEDEIRKEAKDTLEFFKEQDVKVKIISGDSYKTVLKIANKVGLKNLNGIDASTLTDDNVFEEAEKNDIFGRVTPHMKKKLVHALKEHGYTVAMTGDGVNDVLALKEADCSVAMASGSDAAKSVSQLVLLDSNFASMPKIVAEGRRTINNIERSASLLLVKTLYTMLLIFTCVVFSEQYFMKPIQLSLITICTIGIPSFVLALEPNHNLIDGKNFLLKIFKKSMPGGLTVFVDAIIILLFKKYFQLPEDIVQALMVWVIGVTGFLHLYHVSKPFNYLRSILFGVLIIGFSYGALVQNQFFDLSKFNGQIGLILFLLIAFSAYAYNSIEKMVTFFSDFKNNMRKIINKKMNN